MKLKLLIIGMALLASALPSYAGGIMMMGGGAAVSGCSEPATGTVIIGSSTTSTASQDTVGPSWEYYFNVNSAATWSETCTTTTVATIEVYMQGWAGGNCKAMLANSDGTIAATSNASAIEYEDAASWHSFTLGTPPTVTKSTNYKLAVVCDTDSAVQMPFNDTGTDTYCKFSGSYASPTSLTCTSGFDTSATFGGYRAKH